MFSVSGRYQSGANPRLLLHSAAASPRSTISLYRSYSFASPSSERLSALKPAQFHLFSRFICCSCVKIVTDSFSGSQSCFWGPTALRISPWSTETSSSVCLVNQNLGGTKNIDHVNTPDAADPVWVHQEAQMLQCCDESPN